jgi:hypothetical protein
MKEDLIITKYTEWTCGLMLITSTYYFIEPDGRTLRWFIGTFPFLEKISVLLFCFLLANIPLLGLVSTGMILRNDFRKLGIVCFISICLLILAFAQVDYSEC